jgi:hypothetical protein
MSPLLERRPVPRKLPPLPDPPRPCTERGLRIHDDPEVILTTADFIQVLAYLYDWSKEARSLTAGDVKFLAEEHQLLFAYVIEITKIAKIRQLLSARSSTETRERTLTLSNNPPGPATAEAASTRVSPRNPSRPLTTVTNKSSRNAGRPSTSSAAAASSSAKPPEIAQNATRRTSGRLRKPINGAGNRVSDGEDEGGSEGEDVASWFRTKDGQYECPVCQHRLKRPWNLKGERALVARTVDQAVADS